MMRLSDGHNVSMSSGNGGASTGQSTREPWIWRMLGPIQDRGGM